MLMRMLMRPTPITYSHDVAWTTRLMRPGRERDGGRGSVKRSGGGCRSGNADYESGPRQRNRLLVLVATLLLCNRRGVDSYLIQPRAFSVRSLPVPPLQAEAGAPDVLARLSNACAKIGGSDASKLAPVACLALELLFTLERCRMSLSSRLTLSLFLINSMNIDKSLESPRRCVVTPPPPRGVIASGKQ